MHAHESPFLSTTDAARFLGTDATGCPLISPKTIERWRVEGRGPAFRKLGRRVMYTRDDLLAWAERQRRTSTSDSGHGAGSSTSAARPTTG